MGFKVGDKVRHHHCTPSGPSCPRIGRVLTVAQLFPDGVEGDDCGFFKVEDLELVDPVERVGKLDDSRLPEVVKKATIDVKQAFKDADPERVAIVFQRDLAKAAETRKVEEGLPRDAAARKALPICSGVIDYFPDALAAVAECSRVGNEQHNPGQPLHWAKEKSFDHEDALVRHLMDRGKIDSDGVRHSAKVAWRALAMLQTEIDKERKS